MSIIRFTTLTLLAGLFLAACAGAPVYAPAAPPVMVPAPAQGQTDARPVPSPGAHQPGSGPEISAPPEVAVPPTPAPLPRSSGATASLLEEGRHQRAAGNLAMATSALERAIRINPRDPNVWLELGRVKLQEGDYAQAENMGRRAAAAAGADSHLRPQIEELIALARRAAGKGG
jgi:tetratricopeptide (TPR) repeat protein